MGKSTKSCYKVRRSACAVVCCLAVSACNGFHASQPATAFGSFSSSSQNQIRFLEATGRRQSVSTERKKVSGNQRTKRWRGRKINESTTLSPVRVQTNSSLKKKSHPNDNLMITQALSHELLTREEERELGLKIQRASKVKATVAKFVEQKQLSLHEFNKEEADNINGFTSNMLVDKNPNLGVDEEDVECLSIFGVQSDRLESMDSRRLSGIVGMDDEGLGWERLRETEYDIVETSQFSSFQKTSSRVSIDDMLTEEDVVVELGIAGGRDELTRIIVDGALAREKMISSNVRLVLSIAKTWCQRNTAFSGTAQYIGSWDRPSLDEAVQEGILGLSIAADRFEPERNLKFATYATWWVTNSVRSCFNRAREVGLRVPVTFHLYRQKYHAFVKQQYELTGNAVTLEAAAKELDLTPKRLSFILQSTTTPLSIDAPPNQFQRSSMPGKAGSDDRSDVSSTLAARLKSPEPSLEDQIEISLLRQCLENAMAAELSPHERDILRLRHGLDDGVSRTAREVAEICGGSVSLSDVRKVEIRACRKLRSPYSVHTARLYDFLEYVGADIATAKK